MGHSIHHPGTQKVTGPQHGLGQSEAWWGKAHAAREHLLAVGDGIMALAVVSRLPDRRSPPMVSAAIAL